jgi:hypothetical protein
MTDKTEKTELPRKGMQPSLPRRPSYEKAVQEIEKWANSSGLQRPS